MKRITYCFLVLISCSLIVGCGGQHSDKLKVSGTVTFDGQPIPAGDISFIAADGAVDSSSGRITNGQFSFEAKPGNKRVEIFATRPGKIDPAMGPEQEMYIPVRYNSQSKLTAEVDPAKINTYEFDLSAAPHSARSSELHRDV